MGIGKNDLVGIKRVKKETCIGEGTRQYIRSMKVWKKSKEIIQINGVTAYMIIGILHCTVGNGCLCGLKEKVLNQCKH